MEDAAMFKAFLLSRCLLSPYFVPSTLLDRRDMMVSKENIISALYIQVQEAENKSEKNKNNNKLKIKINNDKL